MPLLDTPDDGSDAPEATFPQLAQQNEGPSPGWLDTLGAAFRSDNLVGQIYDRVHTDSLIPQGEDQPGFNPVDHIPAGYLHQYGSRFLEATNPEQVSQVQREIDAERADQATLARAGHWGTAASLAAGLTDPLTLASMALVPEAAPTRLGNALRWGLTNAAISAGQEALSPSLTATPADAALNIGASAVLGGVLGPFARRVPAEDLKPLQEGLGRALQDGVEDTVLGPAQRSVADPRGVVTPLWDRGAPEVEEPPYEAPGTSASGEPTEASSAATMGAAGAEERWSHEGKPVWEMKPEQMQAAADDLTERDVQTLTPVFGEADARRFVRLSASASEKAPAQAQEMLEGLSTQQRQSVEAWQSGASALAPSAQEMRGLARTAGGVGAQTPQQLERSMRFALAKIGEARDPRLMSPDQMDGLVQLRAAQRFAEAQGWDARAISEGAAINAAAKAARPAESAAGAPATSAGLSDVPVEQTSVNPEMESTAGAAAARGPLADSMRTAAGGQWMEKTIGRVAPAARIMRRASLAARVLLSELANIPGAMARNVEGFASANPIERILWRYEGLHVQGMKARRAAFGQYLMRMRKEGATPLSRRDFMEGIAFAMRRADRSPIPEIEQAARRTREMIFDPLYQRAVKRGLVAPEAQLHADSYLTRQYDAQKIRKNFGQWLETLRQGFIRQGVEPAEALDLAHSASRNVLGSERGMMDWHVMDGIVPKSGNLKERTLALPDQVLEPFLNNDIDHLSHSYLRSMAPEVEMTERFGSRDLKDQFQEITDEYSHLMEIARSQKDIPKVEALNAERDANLKDLSAIRDRLYGIYGAPKDPGSFFIRAGRLLRSVNALRLLGAATLAHFPDLANTIARFGMKNTFGAMARLATSLQATKLSLSEAQRMGAAIDMVMNMSASILGDYGSHSQYLEQRAAAGMARFFTIATGETPLITAVQAMTSTLAQDELLRMAERAAGGASIDRHTITKLAAAGIDRDTLQRIAQQAAPHAQEVNGLRFGMSDRWADQRTAQAFESAVLREAHGVTLRPGVGDTPHFLSTELGKLLLQFKSFAFAANRVVGLPLAQGLAHGDMRAVQAVLALASMGTLSYVAKQKAAGQALETDPGRLALEVLDKSNLLGWTGEVIYPALWEAGFKNLSRWSDRDPTETLAGPSAGLIASVWERQLPARLANLASGGAAQQDLPFRRSDLHFLRRMAPAQNLWYFRRAVNATEDAVGDLFDLPGESDEQRATLADVDVR